MIFVADCEDFVLYGFCGRDLRVRQCCKGSTELRKLSIPFATKYIKSMKHADRSTQNTMKNVLESFLGVVVPFVTAFDFNRFRLRMRIVLYFDLIN